MLPSVAGQTFRWRSNFARVRGVSGIYIKGEPVKKIILIITTLILFGCDLRSEITALSSVSDQDKEWVFAQFNVREEAEGLESYYYYGQISGNLLELIKHNKISAGFILLENVRYWGDGDLIHDYKDMENSGELVFRIENIVKIETVHTPPIVGKGYEQYEDQGSVSEEAISDPKPLTSQARGTP